MGSKKLSREKLASISKPAFLPSSAVTNVSVAAITTDMMVTVVMTMAKSSMVVPVRKRELKG